MQVLGFCFRNEQKIKSSFRKVGKIEKFWESFSTSNRDSFSRWEYFLRLSRFQTILPKMVKISCNNYLSFIWVCTVKNRVKSRVKTMKNSIETLIKCLQEFLWKFFIDFVLILLRFSSSCVIFLPRGRGTHHNFFDQGWHLSNCIPKIS